MSDNSKLVLPSYRLLVRDELPKVEAVFKHYGTGMPDPNLSLVSVANIEGQICGLLALQMVWHMEPLWIADKRVRFDRLIEQLEGVLPKGTPYYSFSPSIQIDRACEANGMERKPWSTWHKVVA